MRNTIHVRTADGRRLIPIKQANDWQRTNCDRIVMNEGEFVREIKAIDLQMIDINLELVDEPKTTTIGDLIKIRQQQAERELMQQL